MPITRGTHPDGRRFVRLDLLCGSITATGDNDDLADASLAATLGILSDQIDEAHATLDRAEAIRDTTTPPPS